MVEFRRVTLWLVAAALALATLVAAQLSGLTVTWNRALLELLVIACAPVACLLRGRASAAWTRQLIDVVEALSLFGIAGLLGGIASYVVAAHTSGYVDPLLASADRSLGFDWLAWYERTAPWPAFRVASRVAYGSIFSTPTIVLAGLAWSGMQARVRAFVAATAVALTITLSIFAWMPAVSAVPYWLGLHPAYVPAADVTHVAVTAALRSGTMTLIDAADLGGLITFPSFHAAAAVLYIWAAWPLRRLRWPVLALNLMMLVATPLEGSHYLVDVLGGIAVALIAIAAVHWPALATAVRSAMPSPSAPFPRLARSR